MTELICRGKFAAPPDEAAVEADWRTRGYSCGRFVDPPGQEWNDFVHRTNELVTVVEGRLALEIAGHRLEAGPGDEVFIPKGAVHSVQNITPAPPAGSSATTEAAMDTVTSTSSSRAGIAGVAIQGHR